MAAAVYYLLPDELPTYYDARRVLELCNDLGDGSATLADLSNPASTPYQLVAAAILTESANIDSALQVGSRYARTELEQLILDLSDPVILANPYMLANAKKRVQMLKQMVADLTFGRLMARRGYTGGQLTEMAPQYAGALQQLNLLAEGRRIFDLDAPKNAGVPSTVKIGTTSNGLFAPIQGSNLFGTFFGPNSFYPLR